MKHLRWIGFIVLAAATACSGGGVAPHAGNAPLPMPSSVSPGSIVPAPMVRTAIQPASAMLSRSPALAPEPPNWTLIPGAASQVTALTNGGVLYVLSDQPAGPDKYIWKYANGTWTNIPGLALQIVASENQLFAINSSGGIYEYGGATWSMLAGGASSIAESGDGTLYVVSNGGVGPDRAIWHYNFTAWTQMPGAGVAVIGTPDTHSYAIAGGTVGPTGAYVLNSSGAIYYLNSDGSYAQLPGTAGALAPTGYGSTFALAPPGASNGRPIYSYDYATQAWTAFPGSAVSIAFSSVEGHLYAVSPTGAIYQTPASTVMNGPVVNGVRIDTDPFSTAGAQHATEVEPSAFAVGSTIVATFQAGRIQSGGAAGIDVATSYDAGHTWSSLSLPSITTATVPPGAFGYASDPTVVYDAKHALWLITSMPKDSVGGTGPAFVVSRSRDGAAWSAPLDGPTVTGSDKPWIGCDNFASSPHYGSCYTG